MSWTDINRNPGGDRVWWQGDRLYWTPDPDRLPVSERRQDVILKRVSYSGVPRPETGGDT